MHFKYLRYIIRHKIAVFRAGLYTNAPLFRLFIHDWSKCLPSEWLPYAQYFYGSQPVSSEREEQFNTAWNHHQKRNKHHWQYWVSVEEDCFPKIYEHRIPDKYVREMVADWIGAGMAIHGLKTVTEGIANARKWYLKNRYEIIMHIESRKLVEKLLNFN